HSPGCLLSLSSSPIITSDSQAPSRDRWTLPLGGGVGKLLNLIHETRLSIEHTISRRLGLLWRFCGLSSDISGYPLPVVRATGDSPASVPGRSPALAKSSP